MHSAAGFVPGLVQTALMLVRRLSDAAVQDFHRLSSHILMDAGELGSRHMTVTWIEVPPDTEQELHSHEEAEQVYVVVRGVAALSAAGDTEKLEPGDLALIPPASDHVIANRGAETLALVSVQSPAVSVEETIGRQSAATVGYDERRRRVLILPAYAVARRRVDRGSGCVEAGRVAGVALRCRTARSRPAEASRASLPVEALGVSPAEQRLSARGLGASPQAPNRHRLATLLDGLAPTRAAPPPNIAAWECPGCRWPSSPRSASRCCCSGSGPSASRRTEPRRRPGRPLARRQPVGRAAPRRRRTATSSSTWPAPSTSPASTGSRPARASPTRSSGPAAPSGRGDPDAINLAARLADGQQVVVPARGRSGPRAGTAAEDGPISLGSADQADLETIDGIGPVTAADIIDFRDEHGGDRLDRGARRDPGHRPGDDRVARASGSSPDGPCRGAT